MAMLIRSLLLKAVHEAVVLRNSKFVNLRSSSLF